MPNPSDITTLACLKERIGRRQAEEIELTAAWSVLREYQAGISRRPFCHACGAWYIISENADVPLSSLISRETPSLRAGRDSELSDPESGC